MKRGFKTQEQETLDSIYGFIDSESHRKRLSQRQIGQELGMSQQVISYKLKNRTLTLEDYVYLMGVLGKETEWKK